jgi:hypothetical protein
VELELALTRLLIFAVGLFCPSDDEPLALNGARADEFADDCIDAE